MNQPYILVRNHECDDLVYAVSTAMQKLGTVNVEYNKKTIGLIRFSVITDDSIQASIVVDARLVTRGYLERGLVQLTNDILSHRHKRTYDIVETAVSRAMN